MVHDDREKNNPKSASLMLSKSLRTLKSTLVGSCTGVLKIIASDITNKGVNKEPCGDEGKSAVF